MNELAIVKNLIFDIRGQKVMIDRDLAILYEIPTKRLNEAVKRNKKDFLPILCFNLQMKNKMNWSQIATG